MYEYTSTHYIVRESVYIYVYNYVFTGPLKKGRGDINNKLHTDKALNNNTIAEYINLWLLRVSASLLT